MAETLTRYASRAEAVRPWIEPDDMVLDRGCGRQVFREVVRPAGCIGCDRLAHAGTVSCDMDTLEDLSFASPATVVGVLVWLEAPARLRDVVASTGFRGSSSRRPTAASRHMRPCSPTTGMNAAEA